MEKMKLLIMIFITTVLSCGQRDVEKVPDNNGGNGATAPEDTLSYAEKAMDLFEKINQYYRVTAGRTAGYYNENYPKRSSDNDASFLWPYDGLMSGVATLQALGYDVDYQTMVTRFEGYYRERAVENIGGYGSQTNGSTGDGDRFYDDNSIVGIDLVTAYELTGNFTYVERAARIVPFLKTGEDEVYGGGLWWEEQLRNVPGNGDSNKPACSNGFATLFLLRYYNVCSDNEKTDVLAFAKRLYNWVYENLRDTDACYWNDKNADGTINQTKWTYNTGAMISSGVLLYRITGESQYLDQAKESASGSYNRFVTTSSGPAIAYPNHDPWFTVKLINSYIEILPYYSKASDYIDVFVNYLDYAYRHARSEEGLYYEDWTGSSTGRMEGLLMQAAALESLGRIAIYKGESAVSK